MTTAACCNASVASTTTTTIIIVALVIVVVVVPIIGSAVHDHIVLQGFLLSFFFGLLSTCWMDLF